MNTAEKVSIPSILVVDDNPLILGVVRGLLQNEKFKVFACEFGTEALSHLERSEVDLIICDVMMPEMSGYELHKRVRERAEYCHIPFVFLTALDSEEEKVKGRESGADDYLTKPFDPKELLALVKGKIGRAREQRKQTDVRYEQYRRKVLHTLSHEFRTPLVAINTGTELLLDQPELEEKKLKTLVEAIQRGGLRLERLVNDFMTLQQIEAGLAEKLFESRAVPMTIDELTDRIISHVKPCVVEQGFELIIERHLLEESVLVYEVQVLDAIARLVQNAVKFSSNRKTIELLFLSAGHEYEIQVKDYGIGFQANQLSSVTQAFCQLDRDKFEQQGSGAGLAIAAAFIGFHQGRLEFVNRSERGAKISMLLPVIPS